MPEPLASLGQRYPQQPESLADFGRRQAKIAVSPFTNYWGDLTDLGNEASDQFSRGVQQLKNPMIGHNALQGTANLLLGGMGYITSPADAAIRSVVGRPVEQNTGIPKEYAEFATQLALPYVGFGKRPGYKAPHETYRPPDATEAPPRYDTPSGYDGRGVAGPAGGTAGQREALVQAERRANGRKPLGGLPTEGQAVDGEWFIPGPVDRVHRVAEAYMADKDHGILPPSRYNPVDKPFAEKIATAFDEMKHAPNDPVVLSAYDAMINETMAQYQAIKASGLKLTPTDLETYPYKGNPRAVVKDIADNNHMAYFRTDAGFGVGEKADPTHPMLRPSGEVIGDHQLLNNDVFRIVHDYFGHAKSGNGFRGAGEDHAWREHAPMYSDEARRAMTTETRGQNSWLNYGPHGDFNRTANAADTIYSDQKVGLLPDWVMSGLERVKNDGTD